MNSWLVNLRKKRKMSQEEVAVKAKIPRTTSASIEQGRRKPSVKNAMKIANVLGFDWTFFFKNEVRESTHLK